MQNSQNLPLLPDASATPKSRLLAWLATVLGPLRSLLMFWREGIQHRPYARFREGLAWARGVGRCIANAFIGAGDVNCDGDEDEKLSLLDLGIIIAGTATVIALCFTVHWAAALS